MALSIVVSLQGAILSAPPPQPLAAPGNLRFEAGAILTGASGRPLRLFPRLVWEAVEGARTYEVLVTWSSGDAIVRWQPVMSLDFPFPMGQPGHQYQVQVRACGDVFPGGTQQASETSCWFRALPGASASMTVER